MDEYAAIFMAGSWLFFGVSDIFGVKPDLSWNVCFVSAFLSKRAKDLSDKTIDQTLDKSLLVPIHQ